MPLARRALEHESKDIRLVGLRLTHIVSTTAVSRQTAMRYGLLERINVNDFDSDERKSKQNKPKSALYLLVPAVSCVRWVYSSRALNLSYFSRFVVNRFFQDGGCYLTWSKDKITLGALPNFCRRCSRLCPRGAMFPRFFLEIALPNSTAGIP